MADDKPLEPRQSRVLLGVVTGVRGLGGEVRVKSFTGRPEDVGAYGPLTGKDGDAIIELTVTGRAKGVVTAKIKGVESLEAAKALKGTELFVARGALPEPAPDEFYYRDLVGLRAELKDGGSLGLVTAVHDYGAGTSLEVESAEFGAVLVPFTRACVAEVDIAAGRLVIDPPPSLLEKGIPEPEADEGEEQGGNG
jgi:16S rRNA processing protein RimM